MAAPLLTALAALEAQRGDLWERLRLLPPEVLGRRPALAAWSALGVVDHLERVERALLDDARRHLNAPPTRPDLRARLMFWGVYLVMWSPLRIKAPGGAGDVAPGPDLPLPELWSRWDRTRADLAELLGVVAKRPASGVFRHPVSGSLTARQGLAFMSIHFRHHGPQFDRLLSS